MEPLWNILFEKINDSEIHLNKYYTVKLFNTSVIFLNLYIVNLLLNLYYDSLYFILYFNINVQLMLLRL